MTNKLVFDNLGKINGHVDMIESNRRSIIQRERDIKVLIEQYKAWIDNIRATGEALYQKYRDENVKTRGRSKTPICFKEKYKLPLEAKKLPRLPNYSFQE